MGQVALRTRELIRKICQANDSTLSPSVTYLTHIPKAFHGAVRVYMSATLVRLIRWSQMMRRYYPMFFLMGVICVPLYRRI